MSESKLSSVLPNNSIKGSIPRKPVSTVYVSNVNNKSSLEDVAYTNDVVKGFSSKAYGSRNIFKFTKTHQLLSQIFIELKFDATSVPLSDYIAYSTIREIRYTVGGSETLTLRNPQLLNLVLEQCETQAKKEALLDLAGRRHFGSVGVRGDADNCRVDVQSNKALGSEKVFYALLPLPWSSLSCEHKIKPFPMHMLEEPLEVELAFNDGDQFDKNSAVTQFKSCSLHFRYAKFGNPEMMTKSVYKWPFHNHFMHNHALSNTATSIDLNGFRKGEVTQILFHCVPNGKTTSSDAGVTDKRYFDGVEMKNLKLIFNGQVIWQAPNNEQSMWQLIDGKSYEGRHNKRRIVLRGTAAGAANSIVFGAGEDTGGTQSRYIIHGDLADPEAATAANGNSGNRILEGQHIYYRIPISEILAEKQCQGHFIGADFSKQSIQLTFDTPQAYDKLSLNRTKVNTASRLYVTYTYRSMYQFDNSEVLLIM